MAVDKNNKERSAELGVTHTELAGRYFAGTKNSVSRRFSRWVHSDRQLMERLKSAGYRDRQHYYTPKQVVIIYEFLGHPDNSNPEP